MTAKDVTVSAIFTKICCTLCFDSQGGSKVTNLIVDKGDTLADKFSVPTYESREFKGWFTERNGAGVEYKKDTVITTSAILYAKWEVNDTSDDDSGSGTLGSSNSSSSSSSNMSKKKKLLMKFK